LAPGPSVMVDLLTATADPRPYGAAVGTRCTGAGKVDAHDRAALAAGKDAALFLERVAGAVLVLVARQQAKQDKALAMSGRSSPTALGPATTA
jgi:hypothetical protein